MLSVHNASEQLDVHRVTSRWSCCREKGQKSERERVIKKKGDKDIKGISLDWSSYLEDDTNGIFLICFKQLILHFSIIFIVLVHFCSTTLNFNPFCSYFFLCNLHIGKMLTSCDVIFMDKHNPVMQLVRNALFTIFLVIFYLSIFSLFLHLK